MVKTDSKLGIVASYLEAAGGEYVLAKGIEDVEHLNRKGVKTS